MSRFCILNWDTIGDAYVHSTHKILIKNNVNSFILKTHSTHKY